MAKKKVRMKRKEADVYIDVEKPGKAIARDMNPTKTTLQPNEHPIYSQLTAHHVKLSIS